MKKWNKIASIALIIPFLFSAIGIIVFNSECSCTGSEHYSLYIVPETCASSEAEKSEISCCADIDIVIPQSQSCNNHEESCGCSDYNVKYLKIRNQFSNEKLKIAKLQFTQIANTTFLVNDYLKDELYVSNIDYFYIDPPNNTTSLDVLIEINQLKIPSIA